MAHEVQIFPHERQGPTYPTVNTMAAEGLLMQRARALIQYTDVILPV